MLGSAECQFDQFTDAVPTSVAIGPDGALYVTNRGVSAGLGEVLRVGP